MSDFILTLSFAFQAESHGLTDAQNGQAVTKPQLVDRNGPGGTILPSFDSTTSAYAKIATLVCMAAILTWFGVPLLVSVTEKTLKLFFYS